MTQGLQFLSTLVLVFKKIESEYKAKYDNFYSNSKAETIINDSDIDNVFESIYTTIISNMQNLQEKFKAGFLINSLIMLSAFQNIVPWLEAITKRIKTSKKRID